MANKAFSFNREARYRTGGVFPSSVQTDTNGLSHSAIRVSVAGADNRGEFMVTYPDIFSYYRLPYVESDKIVQLWRSNPLQFWQNQLNFAVWCATTGCGVSAKDHLRLDGISGALYRFHVYYAIRRILSTLKAPLPQDQAWGAFENPYDRRAYERICSEFGVSPNTDWRRHGVNHGLGRMYNYWSNNGYHVASGEYNGNVVSFQKKTANGVIHIDYIKQDDNIASNAWTTFILDKSEGFTRPGVERLNDSIRTYVWAILGAQAQTRTGILGEGTAFDAQKQFLANVEDAISSPVDLPSSIKRYQDVLQYASSKVDFVVGFGLYMTPSNMELHMGQVDGYNNEIVVATKDQKLGVNETVNTVLVVQTEKEGITPTPVLKKQPYAHTSTALPAIEGHTNEHEEEKTALIVAGIIAGLTMTWFVS